MIWIYKNSTPFTRSATIKNVSYENDLKLILLEQLRQLDMRLRKFRSQHMRLGQLHTCHHLQRWRLMDTHLRKFHTLHNRQ